MRRLLVGATAHNAHVQHMVLALHEQQALAAYVTSGVDCFPRGAARLVREALRRWVPRADREIRRRSVSVPCDVVRTRWRWELPRVVLNRLGARRVEDWWWEQSELALDRALARDVSSDEVGGVLGVEHGVLASLRTAARLGKPGLVVFLSPHRAARMAWVDAEYARDPTLRDASDAALDRLSARRDQRRDEEADAAAWVIAGSSFTARTLADSGVPRHKVLVVPLGGPDPIPVTALPTRPSSTVRFVSVGTAAVHKGTHLLLRAWQHVARRGAELHLYGQMKLPPSVLRDVMRAPGGGTIVVHGSVPAAELPEVYQSASALVFPTLCDGFGMVVSEAFAHGLPVITTTNAGAADLVTDRQNGLILPPGNLDALVDAMRWCLDHSDELFAMRRAALEAAARRTWAHFQDDFFRVVSAAIDGRAERLAGGSVKVSA